MKKIRQDKGKLGTYECARTSYLRGKRVSTDLYLAEMEEEKENSGGKVTVIKLCNNLRSHTRYVSTMWVHG